MAPTIPRKTLSQHDGVLDVWLHTASGTPRVAAVVPKINGPSQGSGTLGGRFAICWRLPTVIPRYKQAWLLWPDSETWPRDGEIDFPEGGFNSGNAIEAYMHRQNGTSGGDQDAYRTNVPRSGEAGTPPSSSGWLASRASSFSTAT